MIRHLIARMIPSGVIGGLTIHAAADQSTADHQLLLGVLTTIGVLGAAVITGFFTLLVARSRSDRAVPAKVHHDLAETAASANDDLVRQLAAMAAEQDRKEKVITRQAAEITELKAKIPKPRRRPRATHDE